MWLTARLPASVTRCHGVARTVAVALVAVSMVLAAGATAQAGDWQYLDNDADHFWDAAAIDRDDNGAFDDSYFDLDNDGPWDTRMYNSRYTDALLETLDFDMDENDEVEIRLLDGDQRVGFDYVLFDRDQNGYWDPWRGYARRIIPGSNVDVVTSSNRRNATSAQIYNFRQQTGQSLLYPNIRPGY